MRVELEEEEEVEMRGGKEWDWVVDGERTEKTRTEKKIRCTAELRGGKKEERNWTQTACTQGRWCDIGFWAQNRNALNLFRK